MIITQPIKQLTVKPTAYSYVRFSTAKQAHGDSLRRQTEAAESYCNERNLHLDDSYRDFGTSAYKGKHLGEDAGLGQFLTACENGVVSKGSYLIIESLDRLSRQHVQVALRQLLNILSYEITVVTLLDEQVYTNQSDTTSLIISITIMSRAHEESAMKSKRLLATWDSKRNTANYKLTANCPFWLTLAVDRTHFILNERVAVLHIIYQMAIDGHGGRAIAMYLNEHHSTLAKGKSGKWYESGIFIALRSRAVLGEFQSHRHEPNDENIIRRVPVGAPIVDYFPQAIKEDVFYSAQKALQSRAIGNGKHTGAGRKGKHLPNILQGILKCGKCGSNYVIRTADSASGKAVSLICANRQRPKEYDARCGNTTIKLDDITKYALHHVFINLVKKHTRQEPIFNNDDIGKTLVNDDTNANLLNTNLVTAENNLESFLTMTTDFSNPMVHDKFKQLTDAVGEIKQAIEQVKIDKVKPTIDVDDIRLSMANALQQTVEGVEPTLNKDDVRFDGELFNSRLKLNRLIFDLVGNIIMEGVTTDKRYQVTMDGTTLLFNHDEVNTLWYLATAIFPKMKY